MHAAVTASKGRKTIASTQSLLVDAEMRIQLGWVPASNVKSASIVPNEGRDIQLPVQSNESDALTESTLASAIAELRHEQTPENLEMVVNHPDMVLPPTLIIWGHGNMDGFNQRDG